MGSGKSSIGRILSSLTGYAFVDTDQLLEQEAGLPIPAIFKQYGEAHFRALETAVLRRLIGRLGLIVATGGGIILSQENRTLLHEIGPVIWLDASTEHLHRRVKRSKRPLLQTENPRHTLEALYRTREPLYHEASDIRIDSENLTHQQTADAVLAAVEKFCPR